MLLCDWFLESHGVLCVGNSCTTFKMEVFVPAGNLIFINVFSSPNYFPCEN